MKTLTPLALVLLLAATAPLGAQEADPADVASPDAIVAGIFETGLDALQKRFGG